MIVQSQPSAADAWLVVAGATTLLALPAAESARLPELTGRLGGPLGSGDAFRAVLESLLGGGIASAPSFALLEGDAAVLRVVLRGEAAVAAVAAPVSGSEAGIDAAFSGLGVATWTERVLEGVGSLLLTVPGSSWTVTFEGDAGGASPAVVRPVASVPVTRPAEVVPAAETTLIPARAEPSAAPAVPTAARGELREEPKADPDSEAYDFLFGDTIYRTQAGFAVRIPNPDPERPGDHDGQTMLAEELGLAGHVPAAPLDAVSPDETTVISGDDGVGEATVLAPLSFAPGPAAPAAPAAPHPGVAPSGTGDPAPSLPLAPALQLERADGSRESLSRPLLIGRSPAAPVAAPGAANGSGPEPRVLTIPDDPDISRTHVRVAVEGDAVVVTDLGSKNGTVITLPGSPPRKLRALEPTVVLPGTLIDLGGGSTFIVRED